MASFIEKLKKGAKENGLLLDISGSKRKQILYGQVLNNPYKIISSVNNMQLFLSLFDYLVQNKKGDFIRHSDCDYDFVFIEGEFKINIQRRINSDNIICIYKLNK